MSGPDLAEFHADLRAVARDLLAGAAAGRAPDWRAVAASGWLGLEVPAELDGAEATFAETAVLLEEIGRAAARGPYAAVAALGVGALALLEPSPGRDALLRGAAAGTAVPVLALAGEAVEGVPFALERRSGGPVLTGTADFVPEAPAAGVLLLPALDGDGAPVLVAARPGAPGLEVAAVPVLDETRVFGTVEARGLPLGKPAADGAEAPAVLRFRGDGAAAVRLLHARAAVAVACDSLGSSRAMLEAAVAYAGVREQFGRRIGSFQAVKHACADMLVQVTVTAGLVDAAVRALAQGGPGTAVAAAMAKAHACTVAVEVAGKAMQVHGGMGYTWESGVHVHLKRAALNRSLFGSPARHRARLAERYPALAEGGPPA